MDVLNILNDVYIT